MPKIYSETYRSFFWDEKLLVTYQLNLASLFWAFTLLNTRMSNSITFDFLISLCLPFIADLRKSTWIFPDYSYWPIRNSTRTPKYSEGCHFNLSTSENVMLPSNKASESCWLRNSWKTSSRSRKTICSQGNYAGIVFSYVAESCTDILKRPKYSSLEKLG